MLGCDPIITEATVVEFKDPGLALKDTMVRKSRDASDKQRRACFTRHLARHENMGVGGIVGMVDVKKAVTDR